MKCVVATALIAAILPAISALAQEQEQDQQATPPLFPTEVELVDVDVVVTDKDGNPIKGLTAVDFTVEEDGQPQSLASFEAIERPDEPAVEIPPRPRVSTNTDRKDETGRTLAVLFDDIHLAPHMAQRAQNAVAEFLKKGTRSGDRVTLVASGGGAWWTSRMPHGRPELIELLKRLEGRNIEPYRGRDRVTEWEAMRIHVYRDQQVIDRVTRRFATFGVNPLAGGNGTLGAGERDPMVFGRATDVYYQGLNKNRVTLEVMERILSSLENTRGRKSLILVSEGFIYDPNMDEFKRVKEASRRSNAAVYFLDTRGLEGISVYNTVEFGPPLDFGDMGAAFLDSLEASSGSESIAIDTGGFTVKNTNDLGKGIQRIADESRNYYVLGYEPTNTVRDGQFRKIKVQVARKGVEVRARKGYYAPTDGASALDRQPGGPDPQLQAAFDSPYELSEVPLRLTSYVFEETLLGKARVLLTAEVDVREFAFEDRPDLSSGEAAGHRFVDSLEFVMVVAQRESGESFTVDEKIDMKLRHETLQRVGADWFPVAREFELQAGGYQAKLLVRDTNSKTVGTVVHEFEVPDLTGFRTSTPIITNDLEPQPEGEQASPRPRILARRVFPNAGMFLLKYDVYGAQRGEQDGMPQVTGGYHLLRVADGSVHRRSDPTLIRATSLGSLSRFSGTKLDGLQPGEYELVLQLEDQLSGNKLELREPITLVEPERPQVAFANVRPGDPLGVTLEKFERLAEGMSYEQVAAIVGDEGEEQSRSVVGAVTTVVYAWNNSNGSHLTATFENGTLVEKEQLDLPATPTAAAAGG